MRLATVTQVDPLLVQAEGTTTPVPVHFIPDRLLLSVGDTVLVESIDKRVVVIDLLRRVGDESLFDWVALDLDNGWDAQSGRTPMVRLNGDRVEFRGQLTGINATSNAITVLPEPYRPNRPDSNQSVLLDTSHGSNNNPTPTRLIITVLGAMSIVDGNPSAGGPLLDHLSYAIGTRE